MSSFVKRLQKKIGPLGNHTELLHFFIILMFSFVLCTPLMIDGLSTGHDAAFHFGRIDGTVNAFADGQLIPMVDPLAANGFGYCWNAFYSPLTSYSIAFLKLFLPTYTECFKVFIFISILLSGIFMYGFIKEAFSRASVGLMAALFYMAAPYHLHDIYTRSSVAEYAAFIFLPLLFWGLYSLFYKNGERSYLITIGAAGMVITHSITAFMSLPFLLFFVIFKFKRLKSLQFWKHAGINIALTAMICMISIGPLMEFSSAADYQVFVPGFMQTNVADLMERRTSLAVLFSMSTERIIVGDNKVWFSIGSILIVPFLFSPYALYCAYKEKRCRLLSTLCVVLGAAAIFLCSDMMDWTSMPEIFGMIQFPWRYLIFVVFFLSIAAAFTIESIIKKIDIRAVFAVVLVICMALSPYFFAVNSMARNGDEIIEDRRILAYSEYLTTTGYAARNQTPERGHDPMVISGDAELRTLLKDGTHMNVQVSSSSNAVKVELPYYYYPGYKVAFTDVAGEEHDLPIELSSQGLIQVEVNGSGYISAKYTNTMTVILSYTAAMLGVLMLIVYMFFQYRRSRPKIVKNNRRKSKN